MNAYFIVVFVASKVGFLSELSMLHILNSECVVNFKLLLLLSSFKICSYPFSVMHFVGEQVLMLSWFSCYHVII